MMAKVELRDSNTRELRLKWWEWLVFAAALELYLPPGTSQEMPGVGLDSFGRCGFICILIVGAWPSTKDSWHDDPQVKSLDLNQIESLIHSQLPLATHSGRAREPLARERCAPFGAPAATPEILTLARTFFPPGEGTPWPETFSMLGLTESGKPIADSTIGKEVAMRKALRIIRPSLWALFLIPTLFLALAVHAENKVMGEIQFEGKSHIDKTSGVWVDGQYVGYVKELKGSKKVLLLPGDHEIGVRQDGYQDFTQAVAVQPGQKQVVFVRMTKVPTSRLPDVTATVKIDVNPSRAAVFMDGLFVGHVGEFKGPGRGMLIAPGTHQIRIALAGYQTFETDINPLANQKVQIKTDLVKNGAPLAEPLVDSGT